MSAVGTTLGLYGGRIASASPAECFEGDWNPELEFDNIERASAWYVSPEYENIKPFPHQGAEQPNTTHVLINPIAARALKERKGIDGTLIPDGFDFDRDVPTLDEQVFRSRLEILTGDSSTIRRGAAMPARVAINKAIELAIQFVAGLESKRAQLQDLPHGLGARRRRPSASDRIILLLPHGEDLQENLEYLNKLVRVCW